MTVQFSWIVSRLACAFESRSERSIENSFSKPVAPSV
jgi:hypothetical protein